MRPRVRTLAAVLIAFTIIWSGVGLAISGGVGVSGTVEIDATNGPQVDVITNGGEMLLDGPDGANSVVVEHDNGKMTLNSSGTTQATVDTTELEGSTSRVTAIDATGADLTIDPADKREISVGGGMDSVTFQDATVDNGASELTYSASSSASATINGLVANERLVAVDVSSGTVVGQTTSDASGSATFSSLDSGTYDVALRTTSAPTLSNAQPSGNQLVTADPVDLSVNVSDGDFAETHGDSVSVTFYDDSDDSQIGTDTVTTAGTAETSWDIAFTGNKSWYAEANSTYGDSTTSSTFTFDTPSDLKIRNESNPDQVIDNATVEVKFFSQSGIITKNASNGTVSFAGLPANEEFRVEIRSDGYVPRQAIIKSLANQQTVYLLPENGDEIDVRFRLDDKTGRFVEETSTIFIQRPLTQNGTTEYKTVAADEFGPDGYTTSLEADQRYRVRLENQAGATRTLEPYSASVSETITLDVNRIEYQIDVQTDVAWSFDVDQRGTNQSSVVRFAYSDAANATEEVRLTVFERGNKSNELINQTYAGPHGELGVTKTVPASSNVTNWVAEYEADRNGNTIEGQSFGGERGFLSTALPQWMQHALSIFGILLVAGLGSQINAPTVAVGCVFVASIAWFIGWLPAVVGGGVLVMALAVAGFYLLAGPDPGGGI